MPPFGEARRRHITGQFEIAHTVAGPAGIGVDRQRVIRLSQPAGELPMAFFDKARHVVLELRTHRDKRRQRALPTP